MPNPDLYGDTVRKRKRVSTKSWIQLISITQPQLAALSQRSTFPNKDRLKYFTRSMHQRWKQRI